jgi:hypothetical protein
MTFVDKQLIKITKRKKIGKEDREILRRNAGIKTSSGLTLLQCYVKYNSGFDLELADELYEACQQGAKKLLNIVFPHRFDDRRGEILQWICTKPDYDKDVDRQLVSTMIENNVNVKLDHILESADISILRHLVEQDLVETHLPDKHYFHPAYFFRTWEDYAWFASTFNLKNNARTYIKGNWYNVERDSELCIRLLDQDHRFRGIIPDHKFSILHHQSLATMEAYLTKSIAKPDILNLVTQNFIHFGFSARAEQNLKQLIYNRYLSPDQVPDGLWSGIVRKRTPMVDNMYFISNGQKFHCIFLDAIPSDSPKKGIFEKMVFSTDRKHVLFTSEELYPIAKIRTTFFEYFGQPSSEEIQEYKRRLQVG